MKLYCYEENQIKSMVFLLNSIEIKGMEQAKVMASVAAIIDDAQMAEAEKIMKNEAGIKKGEK